MPASRHAQVREPPGRDRGEATVELVLAAPLLMLALLAIIQFALWSHATHVAQAAASQALAAARTQNGTAAAGQRAGRRLLDQLAGTSLHSPRLVVDRGPATASATVAGEAAAVLPGFRLPVHAESVGPVERFVPDTAAAVLPGRGLPAGADQGTP
ncbi:TadE/TadG family type IV pilus assembly protein [Amycolatopsis benzoatilytica]|uniref:TadE/TadG family type IV pilus assembly protein n=1 Tax=Amycolatopsis benzoatilytica TaxID=346045 RepID=UPI00037F5FA8|nr:TadE/TadG family type IV pilus assembly protein [Amycolatopsis benzoatilytica]